MGTKNDIIVENLIAQIDNRKPTDKQLAWLRRHLSAADVDRIQSIREASAKIRMLIEDREPSRMEAGVEDAADNEPTEAQLTLLANLLRRVGPAAGITVTQDDLLTLQRDVCSDLIDRLLAIAEQRKSESRSAPITEKQAAYLTRMGLSPDVVNGLSRGVASDVISRIVKRARRA